MSDGFQYLDEEYYEPYVGFCRIRAKESTTFQGNQFPAAGMFLISTFVDPRI